MSYKNAKNNFLNTIKDFFAPRARLNYYIQIEDLNQIKKLAQRVSKMPARSKLFNVFGFGRDITYIETAGYVVASHRSPIYQALKCRNIDVLKTVLENSRTDTMVLYEIVSLFRSFSVAKRKEYSVLNYNPIDDWLENNLDDIFDGFETPYLLPKYKLLREHFPISKSACALINTPAFKEVRAWEEEFCNIQECQKQRERIEKEINAPCVQSIQKIRRI